MTGVEGEKGYLEAEFMAWTLETLDREYHGERLHQSLHRWPTRML